MDTRNDRCTAQSRSHMYTIAIALKERLLREQVPVRYGSSGMPEKLYIYIQIEKAHSKRSLQPPTHPTPRISNVHNSSLFVTYNRYQALFQSRPEPCALIPPSSTLPCALTSIHNPPAPTQIKGHNRLCQFKLTEIFAFSPH